VSTLAWQSRQQHFAAALLDPDADAPDFLVTLNDTAVAERFDVYRNNMHTSLIDALLAAFPVTARLVSEESFRALAREYLRSELPRHAALHDYGAGLTAFLRGFAPATATPYLPDVAALEYAWWQSYGAADAPVLSLRELATVSGEDLLTWRVRLHPAVRLVESAHPVYSIWAAHQDEGEPRPPESWAAECVLITRPHATVNVQHLGAVAVSWLGALAAGATLERAAAAAISLDPQFDLGATLLLALDAGAIQELSA